MLRGLLLALLSRAALAQNCSNVDIGVRPLDDLRTHDYLGSEGGLYPDGLNVCPALHLAGGIAVGQEVVPLDAAGNPATDGKIGFASVGFSLCNQAFDGFLDLVQADPDVDAALVFANGAAPNMFADVIANPASVYWTNVFPQKVGNAGLDLRQIEVVWVMTALREQTLPFPDHAVVLTDLFVAIAQNVKSVCPNARICYVSSLPYMGYSTASPATEPYYFEQGFAQKWLIERQIAGDLQLEWDPRAGPVVAPWIAWGPYLWTNGEVPRSDGFIWTCNDVEPDGTHPSDAGELELGGRLLHFLKSDLTATPWFLASGAGPSGHPADVELVGDGTLGTTGEPFISASALPTVPTAASIALQAHYAIPNGSGYFLLGYALLPGGGLPFAGGTLYVDTTIVLPVAIAGDGTGSAAIGAIPDDPAYDDLVAYAQLALFDPLGADGKIALTAAIELTLGD